MFEGWLWIWVTFLTYPFEENGTELFAGFFFESVNLFVGELTGLVFDRGENFIVDDRIGGGT